MDYAQQQRDPTRHLIGISLVVVFHIILVYALVNGLARKIVDVIKEPLEVSLIEELKPPPPPPPLPPKKVVVQPKVVTPPPPVYVPPPEVVVDTPPPPPQVVVTTAAVPAPPPPVVVAAPPAPPAPPPVAKVEPPAFVSVGVACSNADEVRGNVDYPAQAVKAGLGGQVLVEITIDASGTVKNPTVLQSSNKIFNASVLKAVAKLQCVGQSQEVRAKVPFKFNLEG
jgi:protein TonB